MVEKMLSQHTQRILKRPEDQKIISLWFTVVITVFAFVILFSYLHHTKGEWNPDAKTMSWEKVYHPTDLVIIGNMDKGTIPSGETVSLLIENLNRHVREVYLFTEGDARINLTYLNGDYQEQNRLLAENSTSIPIHSTVHVINVQITAVTDVVFRQIQLVETTDLSDLLLSVLLYLFYFALVLAGIWLPAKAGKPYYWLICVVFTSLLMVTCPSTRDFKRYLDFYHSVKQYGLGADYSEYSFLWLCINRLAVLCGLSWRALCLILLLLSGTVIHASLAQTDLEENKFWCLYLIFPLLLFIVQIRQYLALSLVFYGVMKLRESDTKSMLRFALLVLLAAGIHITCIFYLILGIPYLFPKIRLKHYAMVSAVIMVGMVVGIPVIKAILSQVLSEFYVNLYLRSTLDSPLKFLFKFTVSYGFGLACAISDCLLDAPPMPIGKRLCYALKEESVFMKQEVLLAPVMLSFLFSTQFCRYFYISHLLCLVVLARRRKPSGENDLLFRLFAAVFVVAFFAVKVVTARHYLVASLLEFGPTLFRL